MQKESNYEIKIKKLKNIKNKVKRDAKEKGDFIEVNIEEIKKLNWIFKYTEKKWKIYDITW